MNDTLLWYTTRGSGAVSLVLLSGVVILGILGVARFEAAGWPRFLTTGLHRNLSLLAVVFLALHVITAVVDPFTHLGLTAALVPFGSSYRTFWLGLGTISMELGIAIVVTSLLRHWLGHRAWRIVHWLAYASWPTAVAHSFGTGTDAGADWMLAIGVACIGAVGFAIIGRLLMNPRDPLAGERARFRSAVRREQA